MADNTTQSTTHTIAEPPDEAWDGAAPPSDWRPEPRDGTAAQLRAQLEGLPDVESVETQTVGMCEIVAVKGGEIETILETIRAFVDLFVNRPNVGLIHNLGPVESIDDPRAGRPPVVLVDDSGSRMMEASREEFRRRVKACRKALEDARKAFAAGDAETLRDILQRHTAFTHGELKIPEGWAG